MESLNPHHSIYLQKGAESPKHDSVFIIHHNGPVGTNEQQSSAAAFFARNHKPSPVHISRVQEKSSEDHEKTNPSHVSDFAAVLGRCPPPVPSALIKRIETKEALGIGKVKVILRIANSGVIDDKKGSFFKLDKKKRQVTLVDPSQGRGYPTEGKQVSDTTVPLAPKMFAFDGIFTDEDPQAELCTGVLIDPINAVVQGMDAAIFSFGHSSLGKTYTMIGSDESNRTLGIIPTAIAWLFKAIKEKKEKSSSKFSVRVSALEIGGPKENVRDLLFNTQNNEYDAAEIFQPNGLPPAAYLSHGAFSTGLLPNQTELRCPSAEKAGDLLDAALTARSTNMADDINIRDSHFVYTLHVYQYSTAAGNLRPGVIGGRSRLHLIDFGNCDRTKNTGGTITLSGLGNVLLSIFNGQRHLPHKESRVTYLLKECLGSLSCQATMLAHVSPEPSHYSETLHTTQLASRIHRMRRKKVPKGSTGSAGGSGGSGSSDENRRRFVRLPGQLSSSSDFTTSTDPSSSEQSCDTVIYLGSKDDDGTDAEHPPVYIPSLNCGDHRGQMARALRGSIAEMPKIRSSSFDGKNSSDNSPSSSKSILPHFLSPQIPQGPLRQRPGSVGSTPTHNFKVNPMRHSNLLSFYANNTSPVLGGSLPRYPKGKMPLTGKVAGYRQTPCSPHHSESIKYHKSNSTSLESHLKAEIQTFSSSNAESFNRYGFMDEHKKNMIQQWVECQKVQSQVLGVMPSPQNIYRPSSASSSSPVSFKKKQFEPEPFAWLNHTDDSENNSEGICLTQFKTADSSDESIVDEYADKSWKNFQKRIPVVADVHKKPLNASSKLPKDCSISCTGNKANVKGFEFDMLHKKDSFNVDPQTFEEISNRCEKLVEKLQHEELESQNQPSEEKVEMLTLHLGNDFPSTHYQMDESQLDFLTTKSSEENLSSTIKALDVKSFHYVKEDQNAFLGGHLNEVLESVGGPEDVYNKKMSQLSKLLELYQSVSSINAKCQSHLEAAKDQEHNFDFVKDRGSSFSLSALANHDYSSVKSETSCSELNSLCSEPVKMFDYPDFLGERKQNELTDLFTFQGGIKFCLSMSDLEDLNQFPLKENNKSTPKEVRSDSPVLEKIDIDLAKYAKLKDLQNTYKPLILESDHQPKEESNLQLLPEAKSDPNFNVNKPSLNRCHTLNHSPGNGSFSSEIDDTEKFTKNAAEISKKLIPLLCPSTSPSCSSSLSSGNGNAIHQRQSFHGNSLLTDISMKDSKQIPEVSDSKNSSQVNNNQVSKIVEHSQTLIVCSKKSPKFSRLFKLSKSPLKVTNQKKQSKSVDSCKSFSGNSNSNNSSISRLEKKISKDHNTTLVDGSKNAKSTSFFKSFQAKPQRKASANESIDVQTNISTYNSSFGIDSGNESESEMLGKHRRSAQIKHCSFVKLRSQRGRGAQNFMPSTTIKLTNSKRKNENMADLRAIHCRSSGYESGGGPGFDSEKESVGLLQERSLASPKAEDFVNYDKNFTKRLDYMRRICEIKCLNE